MSPWRRLVPAPLAVFLLTLGVLVSLARPAAAYPWMIRHEYTTCGLCHTDPSGGGLLTAYGRAQSAVLLSTQFGTPTDDPGKFKDFLFGVVPTGEHVLVQGWAREGAILNRVNGKTVDKRLLAMRYDLGAQVKFSPIRAAAILGYAPNDTAAYSQQTWINGGTSGHAVAREYWVGWDNEDETLTIRAGRMNLPFGIRNVEHTLFVRNLTRTDSNQNQQHGVSVSYVADANRGEVMAIVGNFQLSPDAYRERGYAGYVEHTFAGKYAVGLSSLVTYASQDVNNPATSNLRQAHGVFGRLVPIKPLVLLVEADALFNGYKKSPNRSGGTGYVQADVEVTQGVHLLATGEAYNAGGDSEKTTYRVWGSAWWFIAPHIDLRGDVLRQMPSGGTASTTFLGQLHLYL